MASTNEPQLMSNIRKADNEPWYAKFPTPKARPGNVSASDLLDRIQKAKNETSPSYVLVDVRRNDHEGGTISTSINLPAQSIQYSLGTLVQILRATQSVHAVIFYCGSSSGRGPRCAAWFQDCLDENGITDMKAYVLEGGIKGWIRLGRQAGHEAMLQLVDGYEIAYWDQFMNSDAA